MDLRQTRLRSALTQEKLAELAGTTQTVISYLEQGARQPTPSVARRIEKALNTSVDWPGYPSKVTQFDADILANMLEKKPVQAIELFSTLSEQSQKKKLLAISNIAHTLGQLEAEKIVKVVRSILRHSEQVDRELAQLEEAITQEQPK
jgi:transcriptional regulator with XRE-family HTH domain